MSKRERSEGGALVYGGIPRANLMPPEVAQNRRDSARRRSLIAIAGLVIVIVLGGVVASFLYAAAAQQRLADERRITDQLLATQLEYAEVTQIRADIQTIADFRTELGGVEILWQDALIPYLSALGEGSAVSQITIIGDQPGQPQLGATGPLREQRVATVSLVVTTADVPQPWLWLRSWEQLETFADASIDRVTLNEGTSYDVALTINLDADALSLRFAPEGADGEEATSEEDDQ